MYGYLSAVLNSFSLIKLLVARSVLRVIPICQTEDTKSNTRAKRASSTQATMHPLGVDEMSNSM